MQSNFAQCTPYFIKKNQIKILDRSFALFYCNNSAPTIATYDIITAIDDVTTATDDVIHIIFTLLSHNNYDITFQDVCYDKGFLCHFK